MGEWKAQRGRVRTDPGWLELPAAQGCRSPVWGYLEAGPGWGEGTGLRTARREEHRGKHPNDPWPTSLF